MKMFIQVKYIRLVLGGFFVILLCNTCIYSYWPEIYPKYINALVVDGLITSDPGPYEIRLSTSAGVNGAQYLPLDGCNISIIDDEGKSETLVGFGNGIYRTSKDGIRGVCGNRYKLKIITPNGNQYESEFGKMPIPTEIDTIYWEIEPHPQVGTIFLVKQQTVSLEEKQPENNADRKLLRVFDINGRERSPKTKGEILIFQYSDGTVEKRIIR